MSSSAFTPSTTTVTNNVPVNVPVVEASQLITATVTNGGTISGQRVNISRVGDKLFFEGSINFSAAGSAANFQLNMPTGLTIDTSKLDSTTGAYGNHIGTAGWWDNGVGSKQLMPWVDTSTRISFAIAGSAVNLKGNDLAIGDSITFALFLPIAEWAGSGTTTLATRAVEEFVSHDGTNIVRGPAGSLVPSVGFSTGVTQFIVDFQQALNATDSFVLEFSRSGLGWQNASDIYPWSAGNNASGSNFYGLRIYKFNATQYAIEFGNQGIRVAISNQSAGAESWANERIAGTRFRLRKVSSGAQVGYPVSARNIVGDTSGSVVPVGMLGEQLSQNRLDSSPLSLTTATASNVTSTALTLQPGTYEIGGFIGLQGTATSLTLIAASIGTSSATLANFNDSRIQDGASRNLSASNYQTPLPFFRVTISSVTTYYLVGYAVFSGGSCNIWGKIQATRIA